MKKRGQVWVETVIYTLIALAMIGLVLTFVKPKITELQDKATIQQSMGMLNDIDSVMVALSEGGAGNKRKIELNVRQGTLTIDSVNDAITFDLTSSYQFSEPGVPVNYGNIKVTDTVVNDMNKINMVADYSNRYNLTYNGKDVSEIITKSTTPYILFISNNGTLDGQSFQTMDFELG